MRRTVLSLASLAMVLAAGCATQLPEVPPISESGTYLPGKVVWHDLVTPDLGGARAYYGQLFDWTFEDVDDKYALIRDRGELIGGMAEVRSSDSYSYWIPLLSVTDVDRAVATTTAAGGKRIVKPFEVPGRGRVAVLEDPQGATFAVVRSAQGDPSDREPTANRWMWHEIWSDDVDRTAAFYSSLVAYSNGHAEVHGVDYRYLESGGEPRVGLLKKLDPEIDTTWVSYVRVADVSATVARARSLGGEVLMEPSDDVREGSVAIIADPNGAGLVVQEVRR
jgi:predicted enzyme related to lactoylglutathione lyase